MSKDQQQVEKDMLQYLEAKYKESFVIQSVKSMANEGNPGSKNMYELVILPKGKSNLIFDARVGYDDQGAFFVNFEYYKTVLLAKKANSYVQSVVNQYYPVFASTTDLTNIQRVLDKIPTTASLSYEQIIKEHPDKINTYIYIAIPQNPENDKEGHQENFKNLFRHYRDAGHLNVGITLGFYNDSVAEKMKKNPDIFFDMEAPPLRRFQEKQDLLQTWSLDFGPRTFPNAEKYLKEIEKFMIVRKF